MSIVFLLGYPAALIMGITLGLTGGGGSILIVPILVYLFGVAPVQATAYSLGIVGLVAASGAWRSYKSGELQLKLGFTFGLAGMVGVWMSRKFLLALLPEQLLLGSIALSKDSLVLLSFAMVMLLAAGSMIRGGNIKTETTNAKTRNATATTLLGSASGLGIGLVAGFVGAGGGFLIVPALVNISGLDMKLAVATSLFVIAMQSLLGLAGDTSSLQHIDWLLFASVAGLAAIGMYFGSNWRARVPSAQLKKGFGYFVIVMAIIILIQQLGGKFS